MFFPHNSSKYAKKRRYPIQDSDEVYPCQIQEVDHIFKKAKAFSSYSSSPKFVGFDGQNNYPVTYTYHKPEPKMWFNQTIGIPLSFNDYQVNNYGVNHHQYQTEVAKTEIDEERNDKEEEKK